MTVITGKQAQQRLVELDLLVDRLWRVARRARAAAAQATPNHRANAVGTLADQEGTAALRDELCNEHWKLFRRDGIEGISHGRLGILLIFQNTREAGELYRSPRALSAKGEGSKRIIDANAPALPGFEVKGEVVEVEGYRAYYFCVAETQGDVRCEVSLPTSMEGGQFVDFAERIILPLDDEGSEELNRGADLGPTETRKLTIRRKK